MYINQLSVLGITYLRWENEGVYGGGGMYCFYASNGSAGRQWQKGGRGNSSPRGQKTEDREVLGPYITTFEGMPTVILGHLLGPTS